MTSSGLFSLVRQSFSRATEDIIQLISHNGYYSARPFVTLLKMADANAHKNSEDESGKGFQ